MAYPPVRLLRPSALQIDVATPCVLEINIPIALPHKIDPSLPAPPYILADNTDTNAEASPTTPEDFRDIHALPLVRRLVARIFSHLFGSDTPGAGTTGVESMPKDMGLLLASWDSSTVIDKQNGFDFAAGRWIDEHGIEGHGVVHAYNDYFDCVEVLHALRFYLVRGVPDAGVLRETNPRVLKFDVTEDSDEGGTLVFEIKEYTEGMRGRFIIGVVAWLMESVEEVAPVLAAQEV